MGKKKVIEQSQIETQKGGSQSAPTVHLAGAKKLKKIDQGRVYIKASYNNTLVSVTDQLGNLIAWVSAGSLGFGGPKKATPFAASKIIAVSAGWAFTIIIPVITGINPVFNKGAVVEFQFALGHNPFNPLTGT